MAKDLFIKGYGEDSKDKGRLSRRHAAAIGMALLVILVAALAFKEWQRRSQAKPSPADRQKVTRRMPLPPRSTEDKDPKSSASPSKKSRAQLPEMRLAMEAEAPPLKSEAKGPAAENKESKSAQLAKMTEPKRKAGSEVDRPQPQKGESDETTPAAEDLGSRPTQKGYVIQVGAFRRLEAAKNIQKRLMKQGYDSYLDARNLPELGLVHRVRIRGYESVATAKKDMERIRKEEGLRCFVLKLESD